MQRSSIHRDLIVNLADTQKMPAMYVNRFQVAAGGPGSRERTAQQRR
jgi:hypothetical protein